MATAKLSRKDMAQDEFIDGVFDFGEWLEVHWRTVALGLGAAVALVLAGVGWNTMRENSAAEANRLLSSGIEAFAPPAGPNGQAAPPRYTEALTLFEQAADRGGSQAIGDVARLFRARTLIALSRAAEAVPILEGLVKSGGSQLSATAKISLAEALELSGNADRAAAMLQEVSAQGKDAAYPADAVLMLLGGVRERQGKKDEAKRVYDDLLARFPQSPFAASVRERSGSLTGATN